MSPTLLSTLPLPPNSGIVRWLQQHKTTASGSPELAALTLLAWLAPADAEPTSHRSGWAAMLNLSFHYDTRSFQGIGNYDSFGHTNVGIQMVRLDPLHAVEDH